MMQTRFSSSVADLKARADILAAQIGAAARRASRDPAYALVQGIAPVRAMSLFQAEPSSSVSSLADWMRGAVAAHLPAGFTYRIEETYGGEASLTVWPEPR